MLAATCRANGSQSLLMQSEGFADDPVMTTLAYIQHVREIRTKAAGFTVIGIFLFFGAIMASLAATTLLRPGTALDRLWALNPTARGQLASVGRLAGLLFLLLGVALAAAGIGWFRRQLWGWRLAIVIIVTQILGDVLNCIRGDWLRGVTGVIIAGALLLFLLQPRIRATFA
jgi:hypothetical protein